MLSSAVKVRVRGPVPRRLVKVSNAAKKSAWMAVAMHFHREMVPQRFTPEFAREAEYGPRKGEYMARGSKQWRRSYFGKKYLSPDAGGGPNRADPLVFTGRTKELVVGGFPSVTATSKGAKVRYAGANTLNFRQPTSDVNMREEFVTVLDREADELARVWDADYDRRMNEADAG